MLAVVALHQDKLVLCATRSTFPGDPADAADSPLSEHGGFLNIAKAWCSSHNEHFTP